MYITITAQKLGGNYSQSSADFVGYLEKENEGLSSSDQELFFNQYGDDISAQEVIREIDGNTAKLKKKEPKFYSITINPSKYELKGLQNPKQDLKHFTREVMKDYVASFNREINGRPVRITDIKYFAKIEHQRHFKGTDKQVRENQPYASEILELKNTIKKIERGTLKGNINDLKLKIQKLEKEAPHQQNGKRIVQGMIKEGSQNHIHIIVSRKDASNTFSLSPGSKYKSSETHFNGKSVKRGFDRDRFFQNAEDRFDMTFGYRRNYAETYQSRKAYLRNPKFYFATLLRLPVNQKVVALKILREAEIPHLNKIPASKAQLAMKLFHKLRKGVDIAVKSGSIGI